MRTAWRRPAAAVVLMAALAVVTVVGVVVALASGVRLVPVLTGSMAPEYAPGSLVVTERAASADVRVGDVIAFRPPGQFDSAEHRPIMHRVVRVETVDGKRTAVTRGDANPAPDPWVLSLDESSPQRAGLALPFAGRLGAAVVGAGALVDVISLTGIGLLVSALLLWPRPKLRHTC